MISAVASLTREIIHLSSSLSIAFSAVATCNGLPSSSRRFIIVNLDAFQSLLAKLREDSSLSQINLVSLPGVIPVMSINLRASAPTLSITSSGSIPLPRDLLIFLPCSSRTSPCRNTYSNGGSPIASHPENTILITQKNRISYPVTITELG